MSTFGIVTLLPHYSSVGLEPPKTVGSHCYASHEGWIHYSPSLVLISASMHLCSAQNEDPLYRTKIAVKYKHIYVPSTEVREYSWFIIYITLLSSKASEIPDLCPHLN